MERTAASEATGTRRWFIRGALLLSALTLALWVRAQIAGSEFRIVEEVQRIQLAEELPPPESEQLPELPEPEPEELVEITESEPDSDFEDELPPMGDLLGLDAQGAAGSDAFGLIARRGGRDLLKTGEGGIGCEWYATVLGSELNDLLLPILQQNERLLSDSWSVLVKLWLEPDGEVERFEVSNTGDPAIDRELASALDRFDRVTTPPPPDMPQPVRLRLRCRT